MKVFEKKGLFTIHIYRCCWGHVSCHLHIWQQSLYPRSLRAYCFGGSSTSSHSIGSHATFLLIKRPNTLPSGYECPTRASSCLLACGFAVLGGTSPDFYHRGNRHHCRNIPCLKGDSLLIITNLLFVLLSLHIFSIFRGCNVKVY